jgi:hypothetical protein
MSASSNSTGALRGTSVVLKASGAETASTTGSSVSTGTDSGGMYVELVVTAASGSSPTMTVVVEGSLDGTNWFTLGTLGANGYSTGSVATAPSNLTTTATVRAYLHMPQYVRTRSVIGGATPSFTYSVNAVLGN